MCNRYIIILFVWLDTYKNVAAQTCRIIMNVLHSPEIISALSHLAQFLRKEKDPSLLVEGVLISLHRRFGFFRVELYSFQDNTWMLQDEKGEKIQLKAERKENLLTKIERACVHDTVISDSHITMQEYRDVSLIVVPCMGEVQRCAWVLYRRNARKSIVQQDVRILEIIRSLCSTKISDWVASSDRSSLPGVFHRPKDLIGSSPVMTSLFSLLSHVVHSDTTVMILGESGTGKELIAHALHANSRRAKGPFIKVNCGALPETIIESELFGHERGAFTGATGQRKGRFELAHEGTLFLDEIGELSLNMQVKLLRVLQEREFERVGGEKTIRVDVRIIGATSRDLFSMTQIGTFRLDLYYRLHIFPIQTPPLRDRGDDIILLAHHFLHRFAPDYGKDIKSISQQAQYMLRNHSWSGNVRELENCMERAVLLTQSSVVEVHALPPIIAQKKWRIQGQEGGLKSRLAHVEAQMIREALHESEGNMAKAARRLELTERIMGLRVKKYNIDVRTFKK